MSESAVETSMEQPVPDAPDMGEPKASRKKSVSGPMKALTALASLRLTVVLFVFAILLVFFGTLAQVHLGLWSAVNDYFRSALIWIPFKLFFTLDAGKDIGGSFPYPGGWLIGSLLLVNLLAAHAVRFKLSWKRSGILLIHAGIIIMMVGELATGLFAVEASMTIAEGETGNFVDITHKGKFFGAGTTAELVLTETSDPKMDEVIAVPGKLLEKGGLISDEALPVDVQVDEFMKNSDLVEVRNGSEKQGILGRDGKRYTVEGRPPVTGVDPQQREDGPAARVTFKKKGTGEVLGSYLVSLWFYPNYTQRLLDIPPQTLAVDGKTYNVEMRFEREYKPYKLQLLDFTHETYMGTDTAKNFASRVRLIDPTRDENREALISMNSPLRHAGETFYQQKFIPGDTGTVLQVVHNPSWLLPYFSCAIVALGMLIHFGIHLIRFLRLRTAQ